MDHLLLQKVKTDYNEYLTTNEDDMVECFVPEISTKSIRNKPIKENRQLRESEQRKLDLDEQCEVKKHLG